MSNHPFLLSIITDEISQDPEVALSLAAEFGFHGVELRSVWDTPVELLEDDRMQALAARIKACGLQVSAIASSFLKDDWGNDDRAKFDRLVKACHAFGCTRLRGFSFWASENYSDQAFADYLNTYDALLEQEGLQLMLENDPSVNLNTGNALARFFSSHNFRNIGILWDPGNDIYTCGDAVKPFPDEYNAVRPFVRHVHVKDAIHVNGEAKGVAPGDGWMDFPGQFRALIADGYTGWVTLEPHFRLDGDIDEELLKRPGGAAFSEGGYMPSKISMELLNKMLSEL